MIGVTVNTVAVLLGGLIGCMIKKGFKNKVADAIMFGLGLCTVYIGISGMFEGNNILILIISVAAGAAVGTALDIDGKIKRVAHSVENKFRNNTGRQSVADGIIGGSLLFCVGAMAVVESLNAGFGDNTMLYTKSMLDFVASMMLAVSLGVGVALSSVTVLIFQGSIALLAVFIKPYLTVELISELTCTGSLLITIIGLNMTGMTKAKVADYLPSLLFVPVLYYIFEQIPLFSV